MIKLVSMYGMMCEKDAVECNLESVGSEHTMLLVG
jgi:hypothetical protein